ncbi:MAG: hypothetical protein KF799_06800 [Bdellovibrionales bacterium]|nr:hypothetical protein [Bdellovibrionales bacterium]
MDLDAIDLNDPLALLSSFSLSALLAAFVFGVVGFYLFLHGRRRTNYWWVWTGVGLMIYPLFISGAWSSWATGGALCILAYTRRE